MTVGSQTKKSSVAQGQGKKPIWKDVLNFNDKSDIMKVVVKDEDVVSDDLVAEGTFNISGAFSHPGVPKTCNTPIDAVPIELYYQNKPAGKLLVTVEYQNAGW